MDKREADELETRRIRLRDPLKLLEAVNAVWLSSPEHEHLLPTMLDVARKFIGADDASILLVDRSGKELVESVHAGRLRSRTHRLRIRVEGVTGWVAAFRKPALIPDVRKDSRYVMTDKSIRSEAAMPLQIGDRLIGVLNLESRKAAFFRSTDLRQLRLLASQLSLAVLSEELRERERRQAEHFGLLYNLARVSHGVLAPKALLQRTVDAMRHAFGCTYAAVFLGDYEREEVVLAAHSSVEPLPFGPGKRQHFGEGLIGSSFRLGETVRINNVRQEPSYIDAVKGTQSELCVPIRVGDHCLGILDVQAAETEAFGRDEVMLLETLGRFLVPTIQALQTQQPAAG